MRIYYQTTSKTKKGTESVECYDETSHNTLIMFGLCDTGVLPLFRYIPVVTVSKSCCDAGAAGRVYVCYVKGGEFRV